MIKDLQLPAGVTYPNPDHLDIQVALDGRLQDTEAGMSDRSLEDTTQWWATAGAEVL